MLLPFSRTFNEKPTNFKQKIQAFEKIHTFRLGHRFKPGDLLHFWDGAPRNRFLVPKAERFNIPITTNGLWLLAPMHKPIFLTQGSNLIECHDVALPCVYATENFKMFFEDAPGFEGIKDNFLVHFTIEGHQLGELTIANHSHKLCERITKNDGFDSIADFFDFFNTVRKQKKTNILEGQIIHWTKFRYTDKANTYKP